MLTQTEIEDLLAFWRAVCGDAVGFRFKDGEPGHYELVKPRALGSDRVILKPKRAN